jgi:tRNA (adenine37-N6)-methyltransferase
VRSSGRKKAWNAHLPVCVWVAGPGAPEPGKLLAADFAPADPAAARAMAIDLDEFSHLEIVFSFHLTDKADLHFGARAARDNPAGPTVGVFGHRNMRRVNWLGVSRCRLIEVDGLDLHVEDLDAVDGSPILDIKPWFKEMGPLGEVTQPSWVGEMLTDYSAPQRD